MQHLWNVIKEWFLDHSRHSWVENHILYFAIIFGSLAIVIIMFIINKKIKKDIDRMELESRRFKVKYKRDTSEQKKKEEEKKRKLSFDEE